MESTPGGTAPTHQHRISCATVKALLIVEPFSPSSLYFTSMALSDMESVEKSFRHRVWFQNSFFTHEATAAAECF